MIIVTIQGIPYYLAMRQYPGCSYDRMTRTAVLVVTRTKWLSLPPVPAHAHCTVQPL